MINNDRIANTPGSGVRSGSSAIKLAESYLKILLNAPEIQKNYKPKRDKKGFIDEERYMLTREWLTNLLFVYAYAWRDSERYDKKTPYGYLRTDPKTVIDDYLNNKTLFPKSIFNTEIGGLLTDVYATMTEAQFYKF